MRYRKLTPTGDYSFGHGLDDFYIDLPQAVAQYIQTRLRLIEGEWFLDFTEGTPYFQSVIGFNTASIRDQALRQRILDTIGVLSLDSYTSSLVARGFSAQAVVTTQYGQITVNV